MLRIPRPAREALALLLVWSGSASAIAQELGVRAEVERPMAATGGEDPTASATEVDARARPTELDTLEAMLREVPGTRAIGTGGQGSPSALSLRGAEVDQLEVLFGDLPLPTADGGPFDLSTVPSWLLDRVEVHRSGAPTWLAVSGIGGVLRLVPRTGGPPAASATLGAGSFGLGQTRLGAQAGDGDVDFVGAAGITTAENDYAYTDDAGTALDASDDRERTRRNAFVREGSGLAHLRARVAGGTLSAFALGHGRLGGVPGPASRRTRAARRHESSLGGVLAFELLASRLRLAIGTSMAYRKRRFADPLGEIGLVPSVTDDDQWRLALRLAARGDALEWLELTGVALYAHDALDPRDVLARRPNAPSSRDAGTLALEARVHGRLGGVRLELRPSARLAVIGARLVELRPERAGERSESLVLAPTFRIGAALEPIAGVTIAASASSSTRAPSAVELFGDRGYLRGDAALAPERAESFDLGVALRGRHHDLRGAAEARGFVTLASDLIRYRRTSQHTAVPENVAGATLFGVELGLHGSAGRHFAVAGALTLLDTRTEYLGTLRRLPLRPAVSAYLRPTLSVHSLGALDRVDLWVDLEHVGDSFASPANEAGGVIAGRTRIGAGVSGHLWQRRLRLDLSVRDVADERGMDLLGFPLPGRSIACALTVASD